ncbi:hypothetical protein E2C01_047077 [Portunus trituberculatus]|uniref:Uncharacterized protein n=1 Tax=Portunus trituberculatus TaxID=210409 RepID=A0A5B7FZG0_PORTR|nr:hypothetical protein [Portunus trituberculatus]
MGEGKPLDRRTTWRSPAGLWGAAGPPLRPLSLAAAVVAGSSVVNSCSASPCRPRPIMFRYEDSDRHLDVMDKSSVLSKNLGRTEATCLVSSFILKESIVVMGKVDHNMKDRSMER